MPQVLVTLEDPDHAKLERIAEENRLSRQDVARMCFAAALNHVDEQLRRARTFPTSEPPISEEGQG